MGLRYGHRLPMRRGPFLSVMSCCRLQRLGCCSDLGLRRSEGTKSRPARRQHPISASQTPSNPKVYQPPTAESWVGPSLRPILCSAHIHMSPSLSIPETPELLSSPLFLSVPLLLFLSPYPRLSFLDLVSSLGWPQTHDFPALASSQYWHNWFAAPAKFSFMMKP